VEIPCIGVTLGGYPKKSSVCKGGILKKKFTGGISKPTYFAGGIIYLTLKIINKSVFKSINKYILEKNNTLIDGSHGY
jgi:hypothetical protein